MKHDHKLDIGREMYNLTRPVDLAAQNWGDHVAIYHYESGKAVTCKEAAEMMNRVGNALRRLGLEVENRAAILMDDCPEWAYAFFGALKIGSAAIPLNPLLTAKEHAFFLNDSRAKVLFIGASYYDKIESILPSLRYLKRIVVCNGRCEGKEERVVDWESFIDGVPTDLEAEPTCTTDLAIFGYTSGSTGRPRAIMRCHGNLERSRAVHVARAIEGSGIEFHIPKLYFMTSLGALTSAFVEKSAVILLSGRPTPLKILEVIAKLRPTYLAGVPTIFARMVDAAKEAPHLRDLGSIRYVSCTGEALSVEVFQSFKEMFGKPIYNCWGSQEVGASPLCWRYGDEVPLEKVGSVGRLLVPGFDVKLVDENGNEVPDGVPGEIMVWSKTNTFLGYWHEPQETFGKLLNGWYRPGDSLLRDKDGYYWYRGRLDEMVKVAGRRIFPAEIEEAVARHPAVLEDAVIPIKNEQGLTELQAFVVLKEGHSPSSELASQIQSFVKEQLAPFKRPHCIDFISELPKTATGKIQRFRLRELTAGQKK